MPKSKSRGPKGEVLPEGIFWRADRKRYAVKYREGRGRQRAKLFVRLRQAERFQEDLQELRAEGRDPRRRKDTPTLEAFADKWLRKQKGRVRSKRLREYGYALDREILPHLGHYPLHDLQRVRMLAEWRDTLIDDLKHGKSVVLLAQTVLSMILDEAVEEFEYLTVNPVPQVKKRRLSDEEKRPQVSLTAGGVEALRLWYLDREDPKSATLISVLAYVGVRPQDALAFRWLDLQGSELNVVKKNVNGRIIDGSKTGATKHLRKVTVPEPVLSDLREWRRVSPYAGPNDLIFPRQDGEPWTDVDRDNWSNRPKEARLGGKRCRCFKRAVEECDLPQRASIYSLRHTAASLYAACGWGLIEISHQLGHKPRTNVGYQHLLVTDGSQPRRPIDAYILEARGYAPKPEQNRRGERQEEPKV